MEGPIAAPAAPADQQSTDGATSPPPGRRKLKRSTRIALIVILIAALLAAAGFATSYFLNARNYVTTDNAQVDGDKIAVNAPVSGTLLDWTATQGAALEKNQVIGRIEMDGGFNKPQKSIRAPGEGTVAVDNSVVGTWVTAGTQLAVAYNLDKIYVTARVDETDVKAVRVGQVVDISVDAFPNTPITGRVREIQGGAAAVFALFPQNNSGGNFQKVTQLIPVKIGLDNAPNVDLVPGMNVTVHIHKN
ncbi:MAG: efflux RND transporter periplasmic adaptor subunit [Pseudonocardiaceae bacterium]